MTQCKKFYRCDKPNDHVGECSDVRFHCAFVRTPRDEKLEEKK